MRDTLSEFCKQGSCQPSLSASGHTGYTRDDKRQPTSGTMRLDGHLMHAIAAGALIPGQDNFGLGLG